jgi:hypothetical protein
MSSRPHQEVDFRCTSQGWPRSAISEVCGLALPASSCRSWAAASWRAEGKGVALNVNSSGTPIFDCPYRPNSAAEQRRHPKSRSPGRSLIGTTPANGLTRGWRLHCTEHLVPAAQQNAVRRRFAARADKAFRPARQPQRCGTAGSAVEAALELAHRHAALKLDSIHGYGVLPAIAKTPIYPLTRSPRELVHTCC